MRRHTVRFLEVLAWALIWGLPALSLWHYRVYASALPPQVPRHAASP